MALLTSKAGGNISLWVLIGYRCWQHISYISISALLQKGDWSFIYQDKRFVKHPTNVLYHQINTSNDTGRYWKRCSL